MLNRMVTLFTQAANGTYSTNSKQTAGGANGNANLSMGDDDTARKNIESEIQKLEEEINRIAEHTSFNGLKPLSAKTDATSKGLGGADSFFVYNNPAATTATGKQEGKVLTFQIGPSAAETIKVTAQNMTTNALFSLAATINGGGGNVVANSNDGKFELNYIKNGNNNYLSIAKNVKNVDTANKAISVVNNAINKVSNFRAELGAAQNRLEHTINSLQVSSENITAAESRIRDTDMADEITQYTKNNILLQAAQSMLSQANATPQGVLSMLQ